MRFVAFLALCVAARAINVVQLKARADVTCSTDDGDGFCMQDESTCNGSVVEDGCSMAGYSCCIPPNANDEASDVDRDEGDEGPGPNDGDHIPDDDDEESAITARDSFLSLLPRKDTCSVSIYQFALSQRRVPYKYAQGGLDGPTNNGFDCSGLTRYAVYQATNKKKILPHSARWQYSSSQCKHIRYADRRKGDLVFWSKSSSGKCTKGKDSSIHHVAVVQNDEYIIAAPQRGKSVMREKMWLDNGDLYKCNYVARCC